MRITEFVAVPGIRVPRTSKLQPTKTITVDFIDCETEELIGSLPIQVPADKDIEPPIRIRAAHFADENRHTVYAITESGDSYVIRPVRGELLS